MRISDWSSDVCSSDLISILTCQISTTGFSIAGTVSLSVPYPIMQGCERRCRPPTPNRFKRWFIQRFPKPMKGNQHANRSEEHTSELQSLTRISYAVFCLKTKITITHTLSTDISYTIPT